MPREVEPVEQMEVSVSVARWLLDSCINLVKHYLGRDFDPHLGTFTDRLPGTTALEDRIPLEDHELRYWTSGVINLVTTIAGILRHALTARELLNLRLLDDITLDENIDPNMGHEI